MPLNCLAANFPAPHPASSTHASSCTNPLNRSSNTSSGLNETIATSRPLASNVSSSTLRITLQLTTPQRAPGQLGPLPKFPPQLSPSLLRYPHITEQTASPPPVPTLAA